MLRKPMWLVNALMYLDWQIFTWHIDVGSTVENAIDWVLDGLNWVITHLKELGEWWEEFRQEVIDLFAEIPKWINVLWKWILDFGDTLASWIDNWWDAIYQKVKDWVTTAIDKVKDALGVIKDTLTEWVTKIESFFTTILPDLAKKLDIVDLIKNAFEPWKDLLNFLSEIGGELAEFFTNPIEYLWQKFSDWFFGGE